MGSIAITNRNLFDRSNSFCRAFYPSAIRTARSFPENGQTDTSKVVLEWLSLVLRKGIADREVQCVAEGQD